MPLGIDPKVDFAFKRVFGSPDHTRVTIHFLNAVLRLPRPITQVEILNPIQNKDRSEDKLIVLDVLAADAEGRRFNIEMQTALPTDLARRLTYYNCLNYVRQLREGDPYFQLRPAISICVLNRALFQDVPEFHLSFRLRCDQRDLVFNHDLQFHTLELPKCHLERHNIEGVGPLEKWVFFLQQAEHLEPEDVTRLLGDEAFGEAAGVLEMISKTPEDRQYYEARMKFLHDAEARLIAAREEGREVGREEGMLAGKIQVLQELLGEAPTELRDLLLLSRPELQNRIAELQEKMQQRGE